jgi:hypothetical protein
MGIWSVLLAIIAVECAQAPPDQKRKLFFLTVPAVYYPMVLLALFSMFAGVKLAYCLGVAVGYVKTGGLTCFKTLFFVFLTNTVLSGMLMDMGS